MPQLIRTKNFGDAGVMPKTIQPPRPAYIVHVKKKKKGNGEDSSPNLNIRYHHALCELGNILGKNDLSGDSTFRCEKKNLASAEPLHSNYNSFCDVPTL